MTTEPEYQQLAENMLDGEVPEEFLNLLTMTDDLVSKARIGGRLRSSQTIAALYVTWRRTKDVPCMQAGLKEAQ